MKQFALISLLCGGTFLYAALSTPETFQTIPRDLITITNKTDAPISGTFMYMVPSKSRAIPGMMGLPAPKIFKVSFVEIQPGKQFRDIASSFKGTGLAYKLEIIYKNTRYILHDKLEHTNKLGVTILRDNERFKVLQTEAK